MARSFDGYYDPPEEAEYTPAEELAMAVDALLAYQASVTPLTFQLEKFYSLLSILRIVRVRMTADELPEYDDPIDAGVPVAAQRAEYEALVDITEEAQS